jgi:hypothetical protein
MNKMMIIESERRRGKGGCERDFGGRGVQRGRNIVFILHCYSCFTQHCAPRQGAPHD